MAAMAQKEEEGQIISLQYDEDADISWSTELSTTQVADAVAKAIFTKGYCVIQMDSELDSKEMQDGVVLDAESRTDWTMPKPEFEASFLGYAAKSKVVWLDDLPLKVAQSDTDPLVHYRTRLATLSAILLPAVREVLGFKPGTYLSGSLLRAPLGGSYSDGDLVQELLTPEEVQQGWVEKHLDFVQRRRLCMMYVLQDSGGFVELLPRPDLNEQPVRISLPAGKLLVFRNDLMTYSYVAKGYRDLVLQSWFMEEPQQLSLGTLQGNQNSYDEIFGGPPQDPSLQVHIASMMCRLPGRSYQLDRFARMICSQTDCFREIPLQRWDMDLYYTSESGQFATAGKSVQKHCGLLMEEELIHFDNRFFNIKKETAMCIPPAQRLIFEGGYELLRNGGFTRKSLQGASLIAYIADVGTEWDPWRFYDTDQKAWLEAASGGNAILTAARLCYTLGTVGPVNQVDTACSASLVAAVMMHASLAVYRGADGRPKGGFSTGMSTILTPFPFIGLSAAGMIGRSGRTRTFDVSANGFARGEGVNGIYCKVSEELEASQNRLGAFLAGCVNQDGRSASLTAPNGPSQQLCIRTSMRQGQIDPDSLCQTENHGTGTALGDPIETGSIAAVFRKHHTAFPVMSHKTNTGHLEGGAGGAGLCKVMICLCNSVIAPNNHLKELNAHMAEDGFPGIYPTALGDIPGDHHVMGLNAFGFGGTNSRAEVWAPGRNARTFREVIHRGLNGLRVDKLSPAALLPRELQRLDCVTVACPRCQGEMCWLCGTALAPHGLAGKHFCVAVRDEFASYDYCSNCYLGGYQAVASLGHQEEEEEASSFKGHGHNVYLVGSWDNWAGFQAMEEVQGGRYVSRVVLGDTALESFHMVLDRDAGKAIFPVAAGGGSNTRVVGPQRDTQGRSWTIDGRRDALPSGSVIEITLHWEDQWQAVTWTRVSPDRDEQSGSSSSSSSYPQKYSIATRTRRWQLEDMEPVAGETGLWQWRGSLKGRDGEEFHFVRNGDRRQCIYPPLPKLLKKEDTPVVGPDAGGEGMGWLATGREGDEVLVQLQVHDGDIEVRLVCNTPGEPPKHTSWRSLSGPTRDVYCMVGPWSPTWVEPWAFLTSEEGNPDIHRFRLTVGRSGREEFHILLNGSRNLALFPSKERTRPGQALVRGPATNLEGLNWEVLGPAGQELEVLLDLGAEDRCSMLTCQPVEEPSGDALEDVPADAAIQGEA